MSAGKLYANRWLMQDGSWEDFNYPRSGGEIAVQVAQAYFDIPDGATMFHGTGTPPRCCVAGMIEVRIEESEYRPAWAAGFPIGRRFVRRAVMLMPLGNGLERSVTIRVPLRPFDTLASVLRRCGADYVELRPWVWR